LDQSIRGGASKRASIVVIMTSGMTYAEVAGRLISLMRSRVHEVRAPL
jgi:hypothetical protein